MNTPTDEQLNLAMCYWIGWNPKGDHWQDFCGRWISRDTLPNYLSDESPRRLLNEAESKLTDTEYPAFNARLNGAAERFRNYLSATARQRVIAILQTVKPELFQ